MTAKESTPEPEKAPLAGDPVPAVAITQQGSTFAERAAAAKKASSKSVDSAAVEDKSVTSRSTSRKKA